MNLLGYLKLPIALVPVDSHGIPHFPSREGGLCSFISYSFWLVISHLVGHIGVMRIVPLKGKGKAVHVSSCCFIFWQVTCLVRVLLQFCTPSRPSTLLAASQRLGRISCYSPLSHLPPVTTSIQPLPVMVPFQYQAFLLQVKVSNQSNHCLLKTAISVAEAWRVTVVKVSWKTSWPERSLSVVPLQILSWKGKLSND